MRRDVIHEVMGVVGYAEPWSAAPGARRSLSLSTDRPIDAVCIRRLDRDGMPEMDWPVETLPDLPAHRSLSQGSWLHVDGADLALMGAIQQVSFELLLTRNDRLRVLLDAEGFSLRLSGDLLIYRQGEGDIVIGHLPPHQWLEVRLDLSGKISILSLDSFRPFALSAQLPASTAASLSFCSDRDQTLPTLNCRLARIAVTGLDGAANWLFPTMFTQDALIAHGIAMPLAVAGNPTFCVTSSRWDGTSLDPRLTPSHYDAIHFHDTDMAGLDWPASFGLVVPADAQSGIYAFEIVAGDTIERIPFFVAAAKPQAPLLFVVPAATYLAYADEYLPPHLYKWIGTDRGHEFARDNDLRSLYDYHSDATGVSLTSTRKPKATLRDDYLYPLCGAPHLLPVDLHFLKFCARAGIEMDLVTDFELHAQGIDLLKRYKGVATGSHPEYLSSAMEAAYRRYIAEGGKLAYLGGNGFAAVAALKDDVVELRRGPTQSGRTWDGSLAEMPLALTNEPGGYFRDRGRGEYKLVGVGIALMGFTQALPYTRTEAGKTEDFAWLFDGVVNDIFGDSGIVLGGVAGYEVDCTNFHLGSPQDIVVLATAKGFPAEYVGDPGKWFEQGADDCAAQRCAEMTYWQHPSGGVVFSASSVSWCGALPAPGDDNDVGKITTNLLQAFSK